MYEHIYATIVILFSAILIYYFVMNQREHQKELDKIKKIEHEEEANKKKLEEARKQTTPCPYTGLSNPRECYFGSNYMCSWNTNTQRCEKKYQSY